MLRHLPNALCVFRMLLVVPIAVLLAREEYGITMWVFGLAALTDGLDGFLAKRFGWTSELGKILDPLADKLLLVSVFITLAAVGLVPLWLAGAAVARDLTITGGAIAYKCFFGDLNGRPTPVSKLNTLCQILYLLSVVGAAAADRAGGPVVTALGAIVFATTVVSGLDYVITYTRKAIAVSRERRQRA
ncbi:MAG: CDP-alcohol phosphatidyltransferase family protein [Gammaproteobacteria bacterium]|nr:CDP-alcohol phosphatidyltransferase [Gammaproteobacteria bacterium]